MREGGVLCLDIGAISAVCYGFPGDTPICEHIRIAARDSDPGEVGLLFFRWFNTKVEQTRPSWSFWEIPFINTSVMGFANIERAMGLHMLAHTICKRHGVSVHTPAIQKVTKFILGNARAKRDEKKRLVQQVMIEQYGWGPFQNFDESDCAAVWAYAEALVSPEVSRKRGGAPLLPPEVKKPRAPRKPRQADLLSV